MTNKVTQEFIATASLAELMRMIDLKQISYVQAFIAVNGARYFMQKSEDVCETWDDIEPNFIWPVTIQENMDSPEEFFILFKKNKDFINFHVSSFRITALNGWMFSGEYLDRGDNETISDWLFKKILPWVNLILKRGEEELSLTNQSVTKAF